MSINIININIININTNDIININIININIININIINTLILLLLLLLILVILLPHSRMICITRSLYLVFDDMPHSPMQCRLLWVMCTTRGRSVAHSLSLSHTHVHTTLSLSPSHTHTLVDTLTHIHTTLSCTYPLSHIHALIESESYHTHMNESCHKYRIGVCHRGSMCSTQGFDVYDKGQGYGSLSHTHLYTHLYTHTWMSGSYHTCVNESCTNAAHGKGIDVYDKGQGYLTLLRSLSNAYTCIHAHTHTHSHTYTLAL